MPANTKGAQKWSDEASGARPLLASRVGLRDHEIAVAVIVEVPHERKVMEAIGKESPVASDTNRRVGDQDLLLL